MLAVGGLYAALPSSLVGGAPRWLLVLIVVGLLTPILISHRIGNHYLAQVIGYVLNSVVTAAMIFSLVLLISQLTEHKVSPGQLLRSAAALWVSNFLVFASWYWRLDGGGPHQRARTPGHTDGAFLFPQMTMPSRGKDRRRRTQLGTKLRRLSLSGLQHEHSLFTHRRPRPLPLGQAPDDDSGDDLVAGAGAAGRPCSEYSVSEIVATKKYKRHEIIL
jgi:hypothetical protein